ncbi:MAG: hypothetical protein A2V66_17545 [Ignavibacteria bacterium RBG_13_36_8]|nr:MAG: hypothetical protein A2V66_17545 [Ignavibacteria bacterium RBG_13_36_8]
MKSTYLITIFLFLSSCSGTIGNEKTITPITEINLEEAKKIALNIGRNGGFDIEAINKDPKIINIELITQQEANNRRNIGKQSGSDPKLLVWYVKLEGSWRDVFPRQTSIPTLENLPFLFVIIDSKSGDVLSITATK